MPLHPEAYVHRSGALHEPIHIAMNLSILKADERATTAFSELGYEAPLKFLRTPRVRLIGGEIIVCFAYHLLRNETIRRLKLSGCAPVTERRRGASAGALNQTRVLQVCQPTHGGAAQHVRELSTDMNDRGWCVEVACSPGSLANELKRRGLRVYELPLIREVSPFVDLFATLRLWNLVRKGDYSILHAHSAKAGAVGRLAAWIARTPAVYTPHGWSFLAADSLFARLLYVAIERILALMSSRIICVSTRELELGHHIAGSGEKKLRLVSNGVAVPPESRSRTEGRELMVGSIVRLTQKKGVDYLVQAAERVCAKRRGVRFSVAGSGPEEDRLNWEIKHRGLAGRFELIGEVRDPWAYLEQIDVFVHPSLSEAMSLALLEAMGSGLPVVATDVGGVRDVIPNATFGTVIPPADPYALERAILRYVDSPRLRESTGMAARRRILQRFTQERMVERTLGVYSEILGRETRNEVRRFPHAQAPGRIERESGGFWSAEPRADQLESNW